MINIILFISFFTNNIFSQIPEPYNSINIVSMNLHGWLGEGNKRCLERLIKENDPALVVELGSWLGLSTSFIASRLNDSAKLYAIDTWQGSAEHYTNPEFSKFIKNLYQQFLSNIIHLNLTSKIIPIKTTTMEAVKLLSIKPHLVYVDASHEFEDVYNDVKTWYSKLEQNGIMCGDDWCWQSVRLAVEKAAKEFNKQIYFDENFWWLDKKS